MPSIELTPDPLSLGTARRFVADYLSQRGLPSEIATLVISELATNVVRYARTPFRVAIEADGETVRMEVWDGAADLEVVPKMASRDGGYGLVLVEKLARDWGVRPDGHGKVVWVELTTEGLE